MGVEELSRFTVQVGRWCLTFEGGPSFGSVKPL